MLRKRIAALGVGILSALTLVGCASLPTSGPVTQSDVAETSNSGTVGLSAPGPLVDATPEQIVRGFIRACSAGYSDDFTVARTFLTPKAAMDWRPDARVAIFDTDVPLDASRRTDGTVEVSAKTLGTVNESGSYTVMEASATSKLNFSLVKSADNQWRIANLADGVLLSQAAFSSFFVAAPLYFLTSDEAALVPDLRWYPRRKLSSSLVKGLLEGPLPTLEGVAHSAFPPGSTLHGSSIEVFEGVANVSLDLNRPLGNEHETALAYWQIESTLRGVEDISSVSISSGKTVIENRLPVAEPLSSNQVIMMYRGNVVRLDDKTTKTLIPASVLGKTGIANPALSPVDELMAFTDAAGENLYAWSHSKAVKLYSGKSLAAPSVDRNDWIWTLDAKRPKTFIITTETGYPTRTLEIPWSATSTVKDFEISPDGTYMAVIREVEGKDRVSLAIIERDGEGTPTKLRLSPDLSLKDEALLSLSWLRGDSLALLADSQEGTIVRIAPIFGPISSIPGVNGATDLTAGDTESEIYLSTTTGNLYQRVGRNWQQRLGGVKNPRYPG